MEETEPNPLRPHTYPRRILVATLGLVPQVLTETLYALVRDSNAFIPSEIHIITTRAGYDRLQSTLLQDGKLAQFATDFSVPDVAHALSPDRIKVIDREGVPLDDLVTSDDNRAAADLIASFICSLAEDETSALHVSIAGGRKTMGFLLGYALSLYGRPQDRLSHVLVAPELESNRDFFYPRPGETSVSGPDGTPVEIGSSSIDLADIPFVRLRDGMSEKLASGSASYSETVALAQERFSAPSLALFPAEGRVIAHGREISIPSAELAFLVLLARRLLQGCDYNGALHWTEATAPAYLHEYMAMPLPNERVWEALEGGVTKEWFEQRTSRLRATLRAELGLIAERYLPKAVGERPKTRIGLDLPPNAIDICD